MTGPWRVGETFDEEVPGVVYAIYTMAGSWLGDTGYLGGGATRKANAVLMAAAPELLAALEEITRCCRMTGPAGTTVYAISDARMDAARAAIEKAKGGDTI